MRTFVRTMNQAPLGGVAGQTLHRQSGFSLIETIIAIGCLGIVLGAFLNFYSNTAALGKKTLQQLDLIVLRRFITANFSCDQSLRASTSRDKSGRLTSVGCPNTLNGTWFPALNHDKKAMIIQGYINGGSWSTIGNYAVMASCDGDSTIPDPSAGVQTPSVRFIAWRLSDGPPQPVGYNVAQAMANHWIDVLDGNEIRCALPDDPGPPIDTKCSAAVMNTGTWGGQGSPGAMTWATNAVPGPFFRSGGTDMGNFSDWAVPFLTLRSRFIETAADQGKPTQWKMYWSNKAPIKSIGTGMQGMTPIESVNPPVNSQEFTVSAASITKVTPPGVNGKVCSQVAPPTDAVPVITVDPACSYWQQNIQFKEMQEPNNWYAAPLDLTVRGFDKKGTEISSCSTSIQLISPLVLTWPQKPGQEPYVPDVYPSMTRFDLSGNGKRKQSGWLGGRAGFLVFDRNGNGKVDDGRELFGDGTLQPRADGAPVDPRRNGFAALAAFDANHDGVIDRQDPIMAKLKLWFDDNSNGESEPWELHDLATFGVERISLDYRPVKEQPMTGGVFTRFALEANFYGPEECGAQGCRIYDVYFASPDFRATR